MAGVIRPYTLVDVLATINNQNGSGNTGNGDTALTTPLSQVGEVDEVAVGADNVLGLSTVNQGWTQEVWGGVQWS